MLIDTHVHFDRLADAEGAILRAFEAGVEKMVAVGGDRKGNETAVDLATRYPGRITAAIGFDREHAGLEIDFDALELSARERNVSAIGEIGLDYHYHPETVDKQKGLLDRMLESALRLKLPVIIHSREAEADTVELLAKRPGIKGVVHCFTGDKNFACKLIDLGFYISFSGIITFKKADIVREAAKFVPEDRLLVETDSPFLAPEPYRGKANEPSYVKQVAEAMAGVRGCSVERIVEMTTINASRLFRV